MITENRINKVEASRKVSEQITNMKFNINFDEVKVTGENVDVAYTFVATYEAGSQSSPKNAGELRISGNIVAKESKKSAEDIKSTWDSKKTLPINFAEDVINLLNFECGSRGTLVAYSIGLVAPLPLSRARLQESSSQQSSGAA